MATNGPIAETEVLSSWKEIALYLGRGVRTAQRWEAELEMPVYRPWGKDHSAVVAMKSEIDLWIRSRSCEKRGRQLARAQATQLEPARPTIQPDYCRELLASSRSIRADVVRNRESLRDSLDALWKTLASMRGRRVAAQESLEALAQTPSIDGGGRWPRGKTLASMSKKVDTLERRENEDLA